MESATRPYWLVDIQTRRDHQPRLVARQRWIGVGEVTTVVSSIGDGDGDASSVSMPTTVDLRRLHAYSCCTTDDVGAEEVFSPTSPSVSAIRGSTKVPCLRPPLVAFPRKSLSRCAHAWSRLRRGRYSSLPQVVATGTSRSSWKWHDGQRDPWRRTRAVQCTLGAFFFSVSVSVSTSAAFSFFYLLSLVWVPYLGVWWKWRPHPMVISRNFFCHVVLAVF